MSAPPRLLAARSRFGASAKGSAPSGPSTPAEAGMEPRASAPCRGQRQWPGKAGSAVFVGLIARDHGNKKNC